MAAQMNNNWSIKSCTVPCIFIIVSNNSPCIYIIVFAFMFQICLQINKKWRIKQIIHVVPCTHLFIIDSNNSPCLYIIVFAFIFQIYLQINKNG
jgi:hypothetical protein